MAERGQFFKGQLEISTDALAVNGWILLKKTGEESWDEESILKKVSDAGIREGFKKEALFKIIMDFSYSKEKEIKAKFAEGLAPIAPKNEELEWESLLLPDDQKIACETVLKAAGAPQIQLVKADGTQEQILVNPQPDLVAWVTAGQVLASVYPPQPGKPGRDLAGKTVPAAPVGSPAFHFGSQILKEKGCLRAKESGFIRRGDNWVDLVPYEDHTWSFEISPDKTNGLFSYKPGHPLAPKPDPQALYEEILALGLPEDHILTREAFSARLLQALNGREPIEREPLTSERDGSFKIQVSLDRLKVHLDLYKPMGKGFPIPIKDLSEELKNMKIKGLNLEAVKSKVAEFMDSPDLEWRNTLIAQGTSPGKEADKELVFSIDFMTQEEWKTIMGRIQNNPILRETVPALHIFSLDQVQKAAEVQAGTKIGILQVPADAAKAPTGVDVFGERVQPFPGNDPTIYLLAGIRRVDKALEATQEGLLEAAILPQGIYMRVRKHRSATVSVQRSEDNMEAHISLVQAWGTGTPLSRNLIMESLKNEQVFEGISPEAIDEALAAARKGQRVENWVVARGRAGSGDISRQIVFYKEPKRSQLTDGTHQITQLVMAGAPFAEYTPPSADSLDGRDVMGNTIPHSSDTMAYLKLGEFLTVSPKDNTATQIITPVRGGEIILRGDSLTLKDRITFRQGINASTGSVKFTGSVFIEGDVESGFYIMSGADVKIKGVVRGALLSSEGNIQISEGVRGEGKAVLRSKKHIGAGYIEKSVILPVGDLHVNRSLLNCKVKCNGKIFQKNPGGTIVGGNIKTKFGLEAVNLGNPSSVSTHISFGQDYLIEDQIEEEEKELDKLRNSVIQLDALMGKPGLASDPIKIMNARRKKVLILKMIQKRNLKLLHLRDKFESHFPSEIVINGTLFPGVIVETHGRTYETKTRKTKLKLVFNLTTGKIEERPLGSPSGEGLQVSGPPPKPVL